MKHFLVVGLGNPEKKYEQTWHNLGFMAIDKIKSELELADWKNEKKFQSLLSEYVIPEGKIIFAKPQTYMNRSGDAVLALSRFYKIAVEDILIIHDELDLPLGTIRISQNRSHAGNNGIKSIIESLNDASFTRIRLGIGPRENLSMPVEKYVLQKIPSTDKIKIEELIDQSVKAVEMIIKEGITKTMNQFN